MALRIEQISLEMEKVQKSEQLKFTYIETLKNNSESLKANLLNIQRSISESAHKSTVIKLAQEAIKQNEEKLS